MSTCLLNADRGLAGDLAVSPAIHQSVNYIARDAEHLEEISQPFGPHYYGRRGNPTSAALARVITERADAA